MAFKSTCFALASLFAANAALAEGAVETKGFHGKVRAELNDLGHLSDLSGKYRLRVTEVTIDPDGYMLAHHHLGPGVRCLSAGELTYSMKGQTTVYKAGDCFTETGDISHESRNSGKAPVVLFNFEILPASLPATQNSLIPIPADAAK